MNIPLHDLLLDEFRALVSGPDEDIDLAHASLAIAKTEYPDLDPEPSLRRLNELATLVVHSLPRSAGPIRQVEALNRVLYEEAGLRGAFENYYDPRNSFLNDVLERKVGIPISLSIAYMAVAARAGVPLGGTAMPMHFLVRVLGVFPPQFVDCFSMGRMLTYADCEDALRLITHNRIAFQSEMLDVVSNAAVLTRLLTNLKMIYLKQLQYNKALPILDRLLVLNADEATLLRERGIALYRLGQSDLARADLEGYLANESNPPDATEIRNLLRRLG